jgi:hypothetical protein
MKETLIKHWKLLFVEYAVVYLFYTFIFWEFKNPFQWVINIPSYSGETRFLILFYFIAIHSFQIFIIHINKNK